MDKNNNSTSLPERKRLKRLSNSFSVPLILQQVFAIVALLISAVVIILIKLVQMKISPDGSSIFNYFLQYLSQTDNSDVLTNIFSDLVYLSYMFIPFIIIVAVLKQNPFRIIPTKVKNLNIVLPMVIIALLFSIVGEFYAGYFQSLLQDINLTVNLQEFSFPHNTAALIPYVIQLSILAPLCEEFIFRGLILQNLRKYGDFFAVLVSSVMFGILHGNLSQTPFAFVVGMGLAFAVIETGSIWVSVIIHCIINSISVVLDGVTYYHTGDLANNINNIYMIAVLVLSVAVVIYLHKMHYFKDAFNRYLNSDSNAPLPATSAVAAFVKTPGFIIFIIIYVISMIMTLSPI